MVVAVAHGLAPAQQLLTVRRLSAGTPIAQSDLTLPILSAPNRRLTDEPMIAEGSSPTHGGEPPHQSERDLLAERRALRAAQTGSDPALVRRAEAAEATVQTLETHLSSLQQRLREAEETCSDSVRRLAANENELRRVKQQEYAEQQLRVEAERALAAAEDRSAAALARSEIVQRLQARVAEVERRASQLAQEIESERRARERTERELDAMRESHTTMGATVSELRVLARKLRDTAVAPDVSDVPAAMLQAPSLARREEMADALAAAVERLRARAEESSLPPQALEETPAAQAPTVDVPSAGAPSGDVQIEAVPTADESPTIKSKPHKHSMSLIGRWRAARKHRREGR